MKNSLLLLFVFFLSFGVFGQDLPTIVPTSPEASALSKFTDVPISHYTGLPNISVPLYTIEEKGITVPVSLSYHARGVLVNEIAPRTGTGWSLQYGGSVSRQIRGRADEAPAGYLANQLAFQNYPYTLNTRIFVGANETHNTTFDFYPDQFSFNVNGISGKFIFDYNTGQPVIQSFQDVKISYTTGEFHPGMNGIDSFTIVDHRGITYHFGISKDTLRKGQSYQSSSGYSMYNNGNIVPDPSTTTQEFYISSWKLMDVILPDNGGEINYTYKANTSSYHRKSLDKHTIPGGVIANNLTNVSDINQIYTRVSQITNYEGYIEKIEFNNKRDKILFIESANDRDDFNGKALSRVEVYHKNLLVKAFNLNYSYTTSTDHTAMLGYIPFGSYGNNPKRMFLQNVEQEGKNGQTLPPYVFTYDPQVLPSMYSSKQDYWGYYNGVDNGPFTRLLAYGNYTPDRRVDTLKSEAGMLKEIQYPTGGKTKLTYEHNIGAIPYDMIHLDLPDINPNATSEQIISLTKDDFIANPFGAIDISLPKSTQIEVSVVCETLLQAGSTTPPCPFDFTINGIVLPKGLGTNYTYNTQAYVIGSDPMTDVSFRVVQTDPMYGEPFFRDRNFSFIITIKYNTNDNPYNIYGPGKRIKKIEFEDENGIVSTKEYEYNMVMDPELGFETATLPSGFIIGLPGYLNPNTDAYTNSSLATHLGYYDANSSFGSFQPNSIGYSGVTEYIGTKANNIGKIEYSFTAIQDTGGDYYEFPYHPPTDNEWLRGKNIRTNYFKKDDNGDYVRIKEVYNKYLYGGVEYDADFDKPGLMIANFIFDPESKEYDWCDNHNVLSDYQKTDTLLRIPFFMTRAAPPGAVNPGDYIDCNDPEDPNRANKGYRIYHLTGGTQDLLRTIEKSFNDNGILEKTTTNNYDYANHYQLAEQEVINSRGDTLKTTYEYPINNPVLNYKHKIIPPVETLTYKNGTLLSHNKTLYTNTHNPGNWLYLPEKIQTSKSTYSLEDRVVYHKYDNKGNPLEVSKKDGAKIYYVWGYNQTQPIAKIEGYTDAQLTAIQSKISIAITSSDNDTNTASEQSLRAALQAIRDDSNMSNAQVTTFTYDPLIGVTSITDPRGQTVYYEYDTFNRLEFVKDNDGNILSENEYNYKN